MTVAATPLHSEHHRGLALKKKPSYLFASKRHVIPLCGEEFTRACHNFPIGFATNKKELVPVAITGLRKGENLFVDSQGNWTADYKPAEVRGYPFITAIPEGEKESVLCFINDSQHIVHAGYHAGSDILPLFQDNGQPADIMLELIDFFKHLEASRDHTRQAMCQIADLNILVPWKIKTRNQISNIHSLYRIDENKVENLSQEQFLALRSKTLLPLIYAHLLSTLLVSRLEQMHSSEKKDDEVQGDLFNFVNRSNDDLFKFY